jgi:2-haloacid dehalogenase
MDRWATFDCYGTLIDWNGGIGSVLARLFGDDRRDALLARYHEVEPRVEAEQYRTYREVLDLVTAELAAEEGRPLGDGEGTAMSESLASWPAFDEVPAALAEAKGRGWRLGILSNCDRDLLESSLPRLGVDVDEVVVAEDVRSYKPAPGHWQEFFERTGAARDHHVHVGASLFHDIGPANSQGMPSVWVNRMGEQPEPRPTREISTLAPLPIVLDELVGA